MRPGLSWHLNMLLLMLACGGSLCFAVAGVSAQSDDLEEARRLNKQVVELYAAGRYDEAVPLAERALAISEKALGAEHPEFAQALNNLAGLYHDTGDYARSEQLHQRVLAIREKILGAEHPSVASSLNNAAALYEAKGDYERAINGMNRAADIHEQNIALLLVTGSEKQKQLYLDTLSGETNAIISASFIQSGAWFGIENRTADAVRR